MSPACEFSGPLPKMNPDTPTSNAARAKSAIVTITRKTLTTLSASGGLTDGNAFVFQGLLQFAGLKHLAHDVAAADKLALHVELRNRRPVGIGLDAVTDFVGFQHVDAFVADTEMVKDLDDLTRKSTHRKLRRAFHEQHNVVCLHFIVDELLDSHGSSCWAARAASLPIYVLQKLPPTQEDRHDLPTFWSVKCALDFKNVVLVEPGHFNDGARDRKS